MVGSIYLFLSVIKSFEDFKVNYKICIEDLFTFSLKLAELYVISSFKKKDRNSLFFGNLSSMAATAMQSYAFTIWQQVPLNRDFYRMFQDKEKSETMMQMKIVFISCNI